MHTLSTLAVLEHLEGGKGSTTGKKLMADAALVGRVAVVALLVSVVRFTPAEHFERFLES